MYKNSSEITELFSQIRIIKNKFGGIPSPEDFILIEIEKRGRKTASELASYFHITIPAIMHKVDSLISDGLLVKTIDENDKKKKIF